MTNEATIQNTEGTIGSLLGAEIPGIEWVHGDDLCDCTFQRIGEWTNPYIGRTLRVRLCCVWAEMSKQHPQFFQEVPAFFDINQGTFVAGTMDWNGLDHDMPRAIWYRQLSARTGKTLAEVRTEYADQEPPRRLMPKAVMDTLQAALADVRDSTEDDNARSY